MWARRCTTCQEYITQMNRRSFCLCAHQAGKGYQISPEWGGGVFVTAEFKIEVKHLK